MSTTQNVEILVVGAGPAGLSVGAECAYHGIENVTVLEKGSSHNQTVLQYYPDDKRVDAVYKGQEAICAGVLCFRDTTKDNFLAVIDQLLSIHPFPIHYNVNIDSIKRNEQGLFEVSSTDGAHWSAKAVVIAIGRMGKPNKPDYFSTIPESIKKLIQFDVRNLNPQGKEILVVGGGNSAVEFALSLSSKANVTLSYRKNTFSRLNPMNLALLEKEEKIQKIRILRNSEIEGIRDHKGEAQVLFKDGTTESFEHVIYAIGGSSPAAFLQGAGIDLDERGNPKLDSNLETNVKNLFVVGELSIPPGKGSIIVSFNSGKRVVNTLAERWGVPLKPEIVLMTSI